MCHVIRLKLPLWHRLKLWDHTRWESSNKTLTWCLQATVIMLSLTSVCLPPSSDHSTRPSFRPTTPQRSAKWRALTSPWSPRPCPSAAASRQVRCVRSFNRVVIWTEFPDCVVFVYCSGFVQVWVLVQPAGQRHQLLQPPQRHSRCTNASCWSCQSHFRNYLSVCLLSSSKSQLNNEFNLTSFLFIFILKDLQSHRRQVCGCFRNYSSHLGPKHADSAVVLNFLETQLIKYFSFFIFFLHRKWTHQSSRFHRVHQRVAVPWNGTIWMQILVDK